MSTLSNVDVENCRDCMYCRTFEDGRTYCPLCNIGPDYMPPWGCEFGSAKGFYKKHE